MEMTIEEKAKAYGIAVKKLTTLFGSGDTCTREEIEHIFPELKESEDEKIRKELLAWLKSRDGQTLPIDRYNAAIAWLEKQGEKDEEIIILKDKIESLEAARIAIQELHKPAEWSEEDKKMIDTIIETIKMSIEDCDVDDIGTKARFSLEKERDWLKSLKDRVQSQSNQEWSEEDERDFGIIYGIIYNSCNAEDASRLIAWLKAIKDRVQPKSVKTFATNKAQKGE